MSSNQFKDIVKRYQPKSYEIQEKNLEQHYGMTTNIRKIVCDPINNRGALFTYLHEVGHVKCGHMSNKDKRPTWRQEYEADHYAIREMKRLKIKIPARRLAAARHVLRDVCESVKTQGKPVDDWRVLRYAYGLNWRKYNARSNKRPPA